MFCVGDSSVSAVAAVAILKWTLTFIIKWCVTSTIDIQYKHHLYRYICWIFYSKNG